jgi:hypothetical protein
MLSKEEVDEYETMEEAKVHEIAQRRDPSLTKFSPRGAEDRCEAGRRGDKGRSQVDAAQRRDVGPEAVGTAGSKDKINANSSDDRDRIITARMMTRKPCNDDSKKLREATGKVGSTP